MGRELRREAEYFAGNHHALLISMRKAGNEMPIGDVFSNSFPELVLGGFPFMLYTCGQWSSLCSSIIGVPSI